MIDLFMPFRAFLKFENVCTDNNVFRMHYKLTVIILLVFTLLVTSKQFFGEPIHCMGDKDTNKDAINSYCWIYGTYTLKSRLNGEFYPLYFNNLLQLDPLNFVDNIGSGIEGKHMAYPGIGPHNAIKDDESRHNYYQWVCFVLLGQAAMFYTPRYLWKIWEGGRLKALVSDLANPMITKDWSEYRRGDLVAYLSYTNLYTHNMYALRYAFCEILNLVNVVGQIFLLDLFLGGTFRNYGTAVATFTHLPELPLSVKNSSINPMDQYFPKLTKCWFSDYGPSGTIQLKDRLCVLPLNIVNEKIFVVIWFWLIFLALISTVAVLFRLIVFSVPPLRTFMIMGQLRYVKRRVVARVIKRFGFGDWFILYLLGKNMNPIIYKDLIIELSKEFDSKAVMI